MKATPNQKRLFEGIRKKHGLVSESLLSNFFVQYIKQRLKKDKDLNKVLKDADLELNRLRLMLRDIETYGVEVPDNLRKYLGDKQDGR